MKKVTLDIDALQVTTFEPAPGPGGSRGTVRGHATALCNTARCSLDLGSCRDSCGCNPTEFCVETEFYCSYGYSCGIDSCVDTCANPNRTLC